MTETASELATWNDFKFEIIKANLQVRESARRSLQMQISFTNKAKINKKKRPTVPAHC